MNEKELSIYQNVSALFMQYGVKSLTMKDIAGRLGISKKTLYSYVKDKNDLVVKCMELSIGENECEISSACSLTENAIEEVIEFSKIASQRLSTIHPSIFYDIKKYHHDAWLILEKFETERLNEITTNNLQRGISEGLYRNDLNIEIIAHLYVSIVQHIFRYEPPSPIHVSRAEYYNEIFNYHIRGIASEKGIAIIKELIN